MITMKNIVVATDLSEPATAALNYGREFARKWGGNLHWVHVVTVPAPASFIRCTSGGGGLMMHIEVEGDPTK